VTDVGIVVPAYGPDTELLSSYVESLVDTLDARIRIELDDPAPGAEDELEGLPATVDAVSVRRGKGAAITAGFEALDAEVLAFVDADGSTPADSVADVVAAVASGDAGLAVGSRRHPDSDVQTHQTFARRRLGDGFAWFARRMLDAELYDYQCGAKAIARETWTDVREHIYEPGFAWDIELIAMAAARGHEIREVPVTWIDRPDSTVSTVETSLELGRSLLRARHRARRLEGSRLHEAIADDGGNALIDRSARRHADDD